ncbi:MAG TPA: dipeptidase, partial [Terriglobales bacterium]
IVIDTHNDITSPITDQGFDLGTRDTSGKTQTDIPRMKEGGLDADFFAIYVSANYARNGGSARRALDVIDGVYEQARRHPESLEMAFTADDIRRIHKSGKIAALMGIEGGHAIEDSLSALRQFYRLGVRYMTLTHSNTNNWADSSGDVNNPNVKHHNGLTDFGKEVVREMNRLGMMVDISHVSDKTFYNALLASRAPVIASHSSARALTNHPRNMTDDMLRAVARNGGVVMVNFYSAFVDENYRQQYDAMKKEREAALKEVEEKYKDADPATRYRENDKASKEWAAKIPRPPLKSLIDHIDHVAKVAGIDHVGLGSDFDGIPSSPEGMDSAADLPKITQALLERGYNQTQIRKILGGNFMRVFADVERVSQQLRAQNKRPSLVKPTTGQAAPEPKAKTRGAGSSK